MIEYKVEPVTAESVGQLKTFDLSVYPIQYPQKYYTEVVENPLVKTFVYRGLIVAAVSCKVQIVGCSKTLYIMALGVLPHFREQGLGAKLIEFAEAAAEEHRVDTITLHVHVRNAAAITLYEKKGYTKKETVPCYYRRLNPMSAFLMEKRVS